MPDSPCPGPPHILVVDDDEALLTSLVEFLEIEGYHSRSASNAAEALALMAQRPPDVIISDIMMSETDGYEFLEMVRANPAWAGIPSIFITARRGAIDTERAESLGISAFLVKPFELDALRAAIDACL